MKKNSFSINDINNKRILVFAAHPDDIEFYIGGIIAKLAEQNEINFVLATSGGNGGAPGDRYKDVIVKRRKEQKKAARLMGVEQVEFWGYADGELITNNRLRVRVVTSILNYFPNIIFAFDPWNINQLHPDHRMIGFSVVDAIIYSGMPHTKKYLGLSSNKLKIEALLLYETREPNAIVDITDQWEKKVSANRVFSSQYCEYPGGWNEKKQVLENVAKIYGKEIGTEYAESLRRIDLSPSVRYIDHAKESLLKFSK